MAALSSRKCLLKALNLSQRLLQVLKAPEADRVRKRIWIILKPTLLVISGPNGVGKSTHIQSMLPEPFAGIWSFDRDKARSEFENRTQNKRPPKALITKKATEMMEERLVVEMKKADCEQKSILFLETPLSHADYWNYLDLFEANGYQLQLNYLCLG